MSTDFHLGLLMNFLKGLKFKLSNNFKLSPIGKFFPYQRLSLISSFWYSETFSTISWSSSGKSLSFWSLDLNVNYDNVKYAAAIYCGSTYSLWEVTKNSLRVGIEVFCSLESSKNILYSAARQSESSSTHRPIRAASWVSQEIDPQGARFYRRSIKLEILPWNGFGEAGVWGCLSTLLF